MLQLGGQLQSHHHMRPFRAACRTVDAAASHLGKALEVLASSEPQRMPKVGVCNAASHPQLVRVPSKQQVPCGRWTDGGPKLQRLSLALAL
jgi:hypothetical protein